MEHLLHRLYGVDAPTVLSVRITLSEKTAHVSYVYYRTLRYTTCFRSWPLCTVVTHYVI